MYCTNACGVLCDARSGEYFLKVESKGNSMFVITFTHRTFVHGDVMVVFMTRKSEAAERRIATMNKDS